MPRKTAKSVEEPHPVRDERVLYIAAYLFSWVSGLLLYITLGQSNRRMKYHAVQSILLGIATFIVCWIPFPFFYLVGFLMWLYGMYVGVVAYKGKDLSMPVIGKYAERYSK